MRDKWRELMGKMYGVEALLPGPSPDKGRRMDEVVAEMKGRLKDGAALRKKGAPRAKPLPLPSPEQAPSPAPTPAPAEEAAAVPPDLAAAAAAAEDAGATPQPSPERAEEEQEQEQETVTPAPAAASEQGEDAASGALSPRSLRSSHEDGSASGASLTEEDGRRARRAVHRSHRRLAGSASPDVPHAGRKRSRTDARRKPRDGECWDEAEQASGGDGGSSSSSSVLGGGPPVQRVLEPELVQAAVPAGAEQHQQEEEEEEGARAVPEGNVSSAAGEAPALPPLQAKVRTAAVGTDSVDEGPGSAPATPPGRELTLQSFSPSETPGRQQRRGSGAAAGGEEGAEEQPEAPDAALAATGPVSLDGLSSRRVETVSAEAPGHVVREGSVLAEDAAALLQRQASHYEAGTRLPLDTSADAEQKGRKGSPRRSRIDVQASAQPSAKAGDAVAAGHDRKATGAQSDS